jgi:hypothetical protein
LTSSLIFKAKQTFYKESFFTYKNNIKKIWHNINELLGHEQRNGSLKNLIYNGQELSTPTSMAEAFNDYFCNIANNLCKELPPAPVPEMSFSSPFSIYLYPTTPGEIDFYIKKLKFSKSPGGSDYFLSSHLKLVSHVVCGPLAKIFNKCISDGCFPEELKLAKVIPLYKSGSPQLMNNYRPISLLSLFSKIFEKIIKARLLDYTEQNNFLTKSQYGFRKRSSTTLAVTDLISSIEFSRNSGKHTLALFLDLRKAFDTVNHELLLNKLQLYGFRGPSLKLLTSYLIGRSQITLIGNVSSSLKLINHGVPQGSVLGPLLFLLYINDFQNCADGVDIKLFADDAAALMSHENVDYLYIWAEQIISKFFGWLTGNRLSLCWEKTLSMFFHANKRHQNYAVPNLRFQGTNITHSPCTKYLGFFLDEDLSMKSHCLNMSMKLRKWVGIFHKISPFLTREIKYLLYYSLFQSILLYGIEVYYHAAQKYLKPLQILQNRALKALFHMDRLCPSADIYSQLKIANIDSLYQSRCPLLLWQILKDPPKLNIHLLFSNLSSFESHKYTTRNKQNFILEFKKHSFVNSLPFKLLLLWNNLPSILKQTDSFVVFKHGLTEYLLGSPHKSPSLLNSTLTNSLCS